MLGLSSGLCTSLDIVGPGFKKRQGIKQLGAAVRERDFYSNKDTEMLVGASLATFVDLGAKQESDGLFNQRKLGRE